MKIGRNEPCWCGSGIKYKKCHLNRESDSPVPFSDIIAGLKKLTSRRYCLHPGATKGTCNGDIVRAHTIQRSGVLSKIAREGHVYQFVNDPGTRKKTGGALSPTLVGVKNVSTFTGFCALHDQELFAPVETQPFLFTQEQCCLLGYRALCMALYRKLAAIEMHNSLMRKLDRGKPLAAQREIQEYTRLYLRGANAFIRDINAVKSMYDEILISKDFSPVKVYGIELESCPEFMCSGFDWPGINFYRQELQDPGNLETPRQLFSFSIIATDEGGAVVFTWVGGPDEALKSFVQSLHAIRNDDKPHAILRFAFGSFENICISPVWWDSRSDKEKETITDMFMSGIRVDVPPLDFTRDDGLRMINWKIRTCHVGF